MGFSRYGWSVVAVNLFVILWGALVRATGSGAGCGRHWPLCNGEMLPRDPGLTTLIEFTHRATSGIALLLVAILFWWSRRALPPGHRARAAAAWSLVFITIEALIGAGLVLLELVGDNDSLGRAGYLAAHLLNTFLLLAALALTAHWSGLPARTEPGRRGGTVPWLLGFGLAGILVVGMTGAIAALGDTLFPARSLAEGLRADVDPAAHYLVRLRVLHPVLAILAGIYLSGMVWAVGRARPAALESRWSRAVTLLVLVQLVVGLTNLFLLAPTAVQLVHLLVADLLWISVVIFAADAARDGRVLGR